MKNKFTKQLLAEFLGTFMLVFAGTGAIIINDVSGGTITHLGIAIVFGLAVLSVIYAYGDLSGAHINPAVTFSFFVAGKFSGGKVLPYIIAQLAGATFASLVLSYLFPEHEGLGGTIPAGSSSQSFILEVALTWWLMVVILSVAEGNKEKGLFAGIAIGSVVALEAAFAGPISGASMNPARSFGPAVISGNLEHIWIYFTATTLGGILAVVSSKLLKK